MSSQVTEIDVCVWDESAGHSAVNINTVQEVICMSEQQQRHFVVCLFVRANTSASAFLHLTAACVTNVLTVNCELVQQHSGFYSPVTETDQCQWPYAHRRGSRFQEFGFLFLSGRWKILSLIVYVTLLFQRTTCGFGFFCFVCSSPSSAACSVFCCLRVSIHSYIFYTAHHVQGPI